MADDTAPQISQILGIEGTGRNPRSSAEGTGQFLNSTWLDMVHRYRPDLEQGRSQQEVLALRNNPQIGREMTNNYAQENQQYLQNNGLPVNPGTTYLAHFLGPAGAKNILTANPQAPASGILGNTVISANPFLRGMTAGDVINWAGGKMQASALPSAQTIGSAPPIAGPQVPPQLPVASQQQPQPQPQPQPQLAASPGIGQQAPTLGMPKTQPPPMPQLQMPQIQYFRPQIDPRAFAKIPLPSGFRGYQG